MTPANQAMTRGAEVETPATDLSEQDGLSAEPEAGAEGYEIGICVYADGTFRVKKLPLPDETATEGQPDETGDQVASFEDALRGALKLFKSNPVGNSEQAQFESGFGKPKEKY